MQGFITAVQIIVAVLLVVVIILQQRGDHKGAGGGFGAVGSSYRSKKGVEQFLFYATVFLAAIFASISILAVII